MVAAPSRFREHPAREARKVTPPASPTHVLRALATHRKCAPEHAAIVRRLCRRDRSVLPRWHQDDRGTARQHIGVHHVASDDAYAGVCAWASREHWLDFVIPVAIAMHREVLRAHRIAPALFRAWAEVKSGYANPRTGRRCIVRPDTLASVLDVSTRQVQSCQAAAREIGVEVVVSVGRMLNVTECFQARRRGSRQRGLSTEVALTVPRAVRRVFHSQPRRPRNTQVSRGPVDQFTPTRGTALELQSEVSEVVLRGLTASRGETAPPPLKTKRRLSPRMRAGQALAVALVKIVPWLASERPGRLAATLARFADQTTPWSAVDIALTIDAHTLRAGRGPIAPTSVRCGWALLAAILRDVDEHTDNPALGLDGFGPAAPIEQRPAVYCGRPECDHGWIEITTDPTTRTTTVTPCPHCPPAVRHQPATHVLDVTGEPTLEPLF